MKVVFDEKLALRAEVRRRDLLLQDLTPGGSEYVNDPERCAAYAKDVKRKMQALAMKEIRLRKEVEAERERLKAALERYGQHEQGCPVIFTPELCNCGLTEALAPTDTKGE